jgi:ABC-type sugar transport system permease subunit
MKNNAGCWYRPCLDDPQSNIFIESAFRAEKRNCPESVCQSVITVMNRPENTANFSNLELRNSCSILSTYTPAPAPARTAGSTTTPEPEAQEETMEPPPIPLLPLPLEEQSQSGEEADVEAATDVKTIQAILAVYVFIFILLVSSVIIASSMRPVQQQGTFRSLFRTFFGTLWFVPVVMIGIVSVLIITNVRALLATNA